jgi:uncharacterized repeat protein (TIGR03803 family)
MRHSKHHPLVELSLSSVWLLSACGGGGSSTPSMYSIGGTLSGLTNGASVVLQDSGGNNTTVSANGSFRFSTQMANSMAYAVTVLTQPIAETCTVAAGSGKISGANVSSVRVTCVPTTVSVIHTFGAYIDGVYPGPWGLIQGSDGNFYGTTRNGGGNGGTSGYGTVFKITPTGVETVLYSFAGGTTDGADPAASLIQGSDGSFYGTTRSGGTSGGGTVFKITSAGVETVLYSFSFSAGGDISPLIQGSDGNFYGTTVNGGTSGNGTAFKITPAGIETVLYSFAGSTTDGGMPNALIQASDGNFYGTTRSGGTSGTGTAFKITPAGLETVLYSFSSATGGHISPLIQGSDGNFYGTTMYGGAGDTGTVFKITAAGVQTVLYTFGGYATDGTEPATGLIQGSDGNFYGATASGGTSEYGVVFKITPDGLESVLYSFASATWASASALIQGSDGNFYGTSAFGGTSGNGIVFKITPDGVETLLHSFADGTSGYYPDALIQGRDGDFYGTTLNGGTTGKGTAFKITPAGIETLLHSFADGSATGTGPIALIQGSDGNFYGTTMYGGSGGGGALFKMTPAGVVTALYSLGDGGVSPLIQGSDGNLYGMTWTLGSNGGTLFKVTPAGIVTVLHSFAGGTTDGGNPIALIQGSDGNLYGTTGSGGTSGGGTVFKITPAGAESVLYSFARATAYSHQANPVLIQGSDGNLYGTTQFGGASDNGTVFKITPAGVVTVLHSFAGGTTDGSLPTLLIQGTDGNLYGTTVNGGTSDTGAVFKITPTGIETVLHLFADNTTDGGYPRLLIQGSDGKLYGTTDQGGTSVGGTLFEVTPAGIVTVLHSFTGGAADGANPNVLIQGSDGKFYGTTSEGGPGNLGTVFKF